MSLDSILSSSVSAEDHTINYVVGSEPIRRDCLQRTISMEKLQLMMPIYFSGVPVLHGSPRQHIWIFAAGSRREGNFSGLNYCPCDTSPYTLHIPSFVGKENFCESRIVYPGVRDFNYCSLLTDDIFCGMGKTVTQLAPAALSTILHTSLKYLEQPT